MFKGLSLFSRCGRMGKEEKLTGIQKGDDDDACREETIMTCDNGGGGGGGAWSDLTHHVLFLVMMQLGAIDFVAFSGVCKSWRSIAFSYMNTFMASRPPMFMCPDDDGYDFDWCCHLKDVEGRRFKTVLPHSADSICLGVSCGYVILYGYRTGEFCLVNLITRHELHFPHAPANVRCHATIRNVRAILVFSPSISGGWVLLVLNKQTHEIWFSRVGGGKGAWDHVSSTIPMEDLQFFKGKVYTIHARDITCRPEMIGVMRFGPKESKITLLKTQNYPSSTHLGIVCSGENLYLLQQTKRSYYYSRLHFKPHKLDFDEMKWVVADDQNTHAFFVCYESHGVVVKPESWWQAQFRIGTSADLCGNENFFGSDRFWYFPHEYRNINRLDE